MQRLKLSEYFGYMALALMSLLRVVGAAYFDWLPVGPAYMYSFVSLKIKPSLLKMVLVLVS